MTTKNQASGLTRIFNSFSLLSNRRSAVITLLAALCLFASIPQAWGATNYYYTKLTVNNDGNGSATGATSSTGTYSTTPAYGQTSNKTAGANQTYYLNATPNAGYAFSSWSQSGTFAGTFSNTNLATSTFTATAATNNSYSSYEDNTFWGFGNYYRWKEYTVSASFAPITLTAPENVTITNLTNPLSTCEEYTGTLTFTASHTVTAADISDVTVTTNSGHGTLTASVASVSGTSITVSYTFKGSDTYGGSDNNRNNSFTVTLKTAANQTAACNVSASFIDPTVTSAGTTEVVYPTSTMAVAPGSATFNVKYADDANDFTASFSDATGGTWTPGTLSFESTEAATGTGVITVPFTFCANGASGDFSATLTLTPVGSGEAKTITVTAYVEPEVDYDVEVYNASGVKISEDSKATWAYGLDLANKNAGSTLKLMRDIDLGSLTAYQSVTANITLDLNGKTLSATVNATYPCVLYVNKASCTLTIIDSKTGGKIKGIGARNNALYCVFVKNGNVVLNSGALEITNTNTAQTTADRLYATGVYVTEGKTFTMNGGSIVSHRAARDAYGIYVNATATTRGVATINGGTINVTSNTYAYGIRGYGDININGGTINPETLTGGYAFGVYVRAAANATAANGFAGSLTMRDGTINSTAKTGYAYGVYMQTNTVGTAAVETPEGTHSNQEVGVLTITGGTMNVINNGNVTSTNQYAYGIYMDGSYSSKKAAHITQSVKNVKMYVEGSRYIYGIWAAAGAQTNSACNYADVELTDNEIEVFANATAQAYAVYAGAASRTIYASTANYAGEYACAAKVTINSGTYTARTTTTNAYAVCSATRAKTTFAPDTTLGGNAEAYPEIIIHGGEFIANSGTTTARAVSSGGNTTIDGGVFTANAGTTTAYGIYAVAGKLDISGATINSEANSTAAGVYIDCAVASITGFCYNADATLKNLTVNVTTRTGNEADGVWMANYKRNQTEATLKSDSTSNKWSAANYALYKKIYQFGDFATSAKCSIIGGTYTVQAAGTTAYGVRLNGPAISADADGDGEVAYAYGQLDISNATISAKTNGTTTVYGVFTGGPTTITNCNITASSKTTTCSGLFIEAGKTVLTGTTINASGTGTVRGIYVCSRLAAVNTTQNVNTEFSGVAGFECIGELEATDNTVTATATGGNTAYGIYVHAVKGNTASGPFAGDHALAAKATINGGTYKATASGTTAYALFLAAKQVQGATVAQPELTVNSGKFWGKATSTYADINTNGVKGSCVLNGGCYLQNTNLPTYVAEDKEIATLASARAEYAEGYRYEIVNAGASGQYVCQIGSTKYKTLAEALQVVTSGQTIVMIADHTVAAGDYVLPAGATLLVPYKTGTGKGATTAIGNSAETTTSGTTPSLFRKLSFANGANLVCKGTIETSAQQKANGQYGANVGMPSGPYGQIHLQEGAHISLESGARLNCWGYITGKGTINVKNGATVLEGFQMGDWCGGSNASSLIDNDQKVFPVTHYFYQSIECPITYRPGSRALGSTHINVSVVGVVGQDAIALVGTTGSMFLMDDNDVSADTWVMKNYDETTDQCVWTVNSGASIGNLTINISGYEMASANYDLPITTNMSIVLNYGEMEIGQNTVFLPGSKLIVNKEGTAVLNGVTSVVYDATDWASTKIYRASYSPSWTTNPRSTTPVDAEFFLHGKVDIRNNGGLYTTASGANIHSTNADAGEVIYTSAAQGNKTSYYLQQGGTTRTALTVNPAKLKKGNDTYATSAGTVAGKTWTYIDDTWQCWSKDGCLFRDAQDKPYAKPAALVELSSGTPDANHLYYDAATGTRKFVWDADCYWWEVETTPTAEGYYKSINPDNNGKYNYYEYNSSAACWKIKTVTVTWNINGTNTNYTVNYGTKPQWLGAEPSKTSSSSDYRWSWDGWTMGGDATLLSNNDLPVVTANTTFTAHFYENYYQYNITFQNSDGQVLDSRNWNKGSMPSYTGTPTKAPTVAEEYTFNGTWTPAVTTVTGPATYVANYTASPRKYTVSFLDYDGVKEWESKEVAYNTAPAYTAAEPTRTGTSAFSYEFSGWILQSTGAFYAKGATLPVVEGEQRYLAQYNQVEVKFSVTFKPENGDPDETKEWKFEQVPSYSKGTPVKASTAEYNYTFAGWTPSVEPATANTTYTATYTESKRSYRIKFVQPDGTTTLQSSMVEYNTIPAYTGETPVKEADDDYVYTFSGWTPAVAAVTGDQTYTATYTQSQNMPLDIVDATETSLTINANGWLAGGWPYTINGTLYEKSARAADRTLVFTHTYEEGTSQQITVKNKDGVTVSSRTYTIPLVYDDALGNPELSVLNNNRIIYVRENTILRVSGEASAAAIYVAPTAELIINNGATLTVGKLVLRTSPSSSAILTTEGTLSATKVYYSRITGDNSQYYQFGLPLSCALSDVEMSNTGKFGGSDLTYGSAWLLKSYSEASRAANGIRDDGANWTALAAGGTIQGGVGYEMMSNSKYYREYYFPVDISQLGTSVAVSYSSGKAAGAAHAGWNILTSPLMGTYTMPVTDPATDIKIAWLQTDGSYSQELAATIPPAKPFSYQATTDQTELVFGTEAFIYRAPRHQTEMEAQTETEWLQLDLTDDKGQTDQTGVFAHPTRFTDSYEAGIDMAKQSLASTRPILYTTHAYGDMAFAGVSDEALEQGIVLTFNSPAAQTLTLSLRDNEWLNRMAYVWLLDNETGERTDLLMDDYRFAAPAGTTAGRLVLQGRFYAPQVATGLDETGADYRIYNLNGNIAVSGVEAGTAVYVFDAVGHILYHGAAEAEDILIPAPSAGVYMLHIGGKTAKMVINK
ncbi:MAG: hypothetical protein IJ204_03300 [Paludibacteraceae bacterium]|nr:hypothetical protein [Paludibacteraceae bacterium]